MIEVGGGAFGENVAVTIGGIDINSGPLPSVTLPSDGGGPFTRQRPRVRVPPSDGSVLTTGLMEVTTEGGDLGSHSGFASSSAVVATVNVLEGILTADVISSECTSNGDGSGGSASIVNGFLAGNPLDPLPLPDTTIVVPQVGTFVFNEQVETNIVGSETTITVNSVHVFLDPFLGTGEIIIAQSACAAFGPDVLKSPPVAVDDAATTPEDTPVTIDVLANDSDPDGDPLTVTSVSDPPNGSVVDNGDGTVTYTPDPDFTGTDSFTYEVCDPDGVCDTATVTVTVTPVTPGPSGTEPPSLSRTGVEALGVAWLMLGLLAAALTFLAAARERARH